MIRFILNNQQISTELPAGTVLLDFIRYHKNLTGTKIGCREGDCGACTVLIGELHNENLRYRSFTSCLTPIGNIHGKHVVTVEGINFDEGLNPIQQAMSDEAATQCGFCTVGFVMSLAGFCLSSNEHTHTQAIAAIDGNICRCTGYKSIERAACKVADMMQANQNTEPTTFVAQNKILPVYFTNIKSRLQELQPAIQPLAPHDKASKRFVGGGSDLYVQKHDEMPHASVDLVMQNQELRQVNATEKHIEIGGAATVADLIDSAEFRAHFPDFERTVKLVSSSPIRHLATIAGNFVNGSPIGDFTIFFLALNATLQLSDGKNQRRIALHDFYKGYKTLDKTADEFVEKIIIEKPAASHHFNFEKVSKRTHLDIASVNSAMSLYLENGHITRARISAGGVGPIPLYLAKTSEFLAGKAISEETIAEAVKIAQTEISPMSDTRGTVEYKRLLLRQLMLAHFHRCFPEIKVENLLANALS